MILKWLKIFIKITLILFVLILFNYSWGIFTRYNYFTAQWDKYRGDIRIVHYGEPQQTDSIAIAIAPSIGFIYKVNNDCEESMPAIRGIRMYNEVMTSYLDKKLGSDWYFDFKDHVDSIFTHIHARDKKVAL